MTSERVDPLEEALRENLKLRRELAAEAAKEQQGGGIAYRLGWVLYWASIVGIALWVCLRAFGN